MQYSNLSLNVSDVCVDTYLKTFVLKFFKGYKSKNKKFLTQSTIRSRQIKLLVKKAKKKLVKQQSKKRAALQNEFFRMFRLGT